MLPLNNLDFPRCKAKNVDDPLTFILRIGQWACRLHFRHIAHQYIRNVRMQPCDYQECKTENRGHFVDANMNQIETAFVHSVIVCNQLYTHHWYPILCFWVISFASKGCVTSQSVIDLYARYLREIWRRPIAFLRLRPAIYGMSSVLLVIGKYSSTSWPFLILLLLLDFRDVPESNFSYLNHVHQVGVESYAVGCLDECSITVIIQTDLRWARTATPMTRMALLT